MKRPLIDYAYDGKRFYNAIRKRMLKLPTRTMSALCEEAGKDFSTAWRWQRGSVPDIETVHAVEKALQKFEKLDGVINLGSKT
jgi:predicted transcriptional regulator